MTDTERTRLEKLALSVREQIIRMSTDGGCFIGASLSCADILVYMYASGVVRIAPDLIRDPGRDIILLSKGHDVPALYATLAALGYFPPERLRNHLKPDDSIYWHPNRAIPGIEFHSGSLGHLLSVGAGMAIDCARSGLRNRIYVIVGDGELNEGSVWEACLVAASHRLDNLTVVVDRNEFQANVRTEELNPLEPIDGKFAAFGWTTKTVDGHSFDSLAEGFSGLPHRRGSPSVIIARTVRGKGVPSIERRADRWFVNFSHPEAADLLEELHGRKTAVIQSEGLTVR